MNRTLRRLVWGTLHALGALSLLGSVMALARFRSAPSAWAAAAIVLALAVGLAVLYRRGRLRFATASGLLLAAYLAVTVMTVTQTDVVTRFIDRSALLWSLKMRLATPEYRLADADLQYQILARSWRDTYLSVRQDGEGRLFVGCRASLLLLEPDQRGAYQGPLELYRFDHDAWISDVAFRGDDLYVMTSSALYLFEGGRARRDHLVPRRLIWGIPTDLHVAFHALAWGPDGDLYFTAGDPLLRYGLSPQRPDHWGHWTLYHQPEGAILRHTGSGGVFRCRPDGSELRIVAGGLRGPFGLSFDEHWNLFVADNDHEGLPARFTPARLLHVVPHADYGWPRGWLPANSPGRQDILPGVCDRLGPGVPVGLCFIDQPQTPGNSSGELILARWESRTISRFPLQAQGATFVAQEEPLLEAGTYHRPLCLEVGADGEILAVVSKIRNNEGSPTYPSDLLRIAPRAQRMRTPAAPTRMSCNELLDQLSSPSLVLRQRAHLELLRRDKRDVGDCLARLEQCPADSPAILHLPWIAAHFDGVSAAEAIARLCESPRADVRELALGVFAEYAWPSVERLVVAGLADPAQSVQLAALVALFRFPDLAPSEVESLASDSNDPLIRHVAGRLLADRWDEARLVALLDGDDANLRLAATLAAGWRLITPPPGFEPPDNLLDATDAATTFVAHYAGGREDLSKRGPIGSFTTASYWSLCRGEQSAVLFAALAARLDDPDDRTSGQAWYFLDLLDDPALKSRLESFARDRDLRTLAAASPQPLPLAWTTGNVPLPEVRDARLFDSTRLLTYHWQPGSANRMHHAAAVSPAQGCFAALRLKSDAPQVLALDIEPEAKVCLLVNGRFQAPAEKPLIKLDAGTNDLLLCLMTDGTPGDWSCFFRSAGPVTVADRRSPAEDFSSWETAADGGLAVPDAFRGVDWPAIISQGDRQRGRELFGHDGYGCAKCHALSTGQLETAAPHLMNARTRFTVEYLMESILAPSARLNDQYRSTIVVTADGEVLSGLVTGETADELELLITQNATRRTIPKHDIDQRRATATSPMPQIDIRRPQDLADLLSYLLDDMPQHD